MTIEEAVNWFLKEEGRDEGLEQGLEQGRKEGRKEGRDEGRKEGRDEGIYSVARNAILKGYNNSMIADITGLTPEAIDKLRKETLK